MQNIVLDVGNNSQQILPVPYTKSPTPNVESPVNYGSSPFPTPLKPSSKKDDDLQYCNFLEPAPRDQRLNVPYEGNKNCPEFKTQPYNKDSCYLMNSQAQGVVGIVCNQAGGSDNANFYRGNQFGVDYPFDFDQRMEDKKLEYTVERPVQIPMELQNPIVVNGDNTFYPEKMFFLQKNKDYITYPLQQNYTDNGLPIYTYPYKTLNPPFNEGNKVHMKDMKDMKKDMKDMKKDIHEGFVNYSNSQGYIITIIILIIVFILLLFM